MVMRAGCGCGAETAMVEGAVSITWRTPGAAPGSTPTAPEGRLATVLGGIVAVLVVLLPVLFGVGFPYSLAVAELAVWILLVVCAWRVPLRLRDQLALMGLALGLGLLVCPLALAQDGKPDGDQPAGKMPPPKESLRNPRPAPTRRAPSLPEKPVR